MKTPLLLSLPLAVPLAHADGDTAQCDRAANPLHPGNPPGVQGDSELPRFEDDAAAWDALRLACENSYTAHPDTPRYAYQLAENIASINITLSDDTLAAIDTIHAEISNPCP